MTNIRPSSCLKVLASVIEKYDHNNKATMYVSFLHSKLQLTHVYRVYFNHFLHCDNFSGSGTIAVSAVSFSICHRHLLWSESTLLHYIPHFLRVFGRYSQYPARPISMA